LQDSARQLSLAIASGDTEAFARFYESWFSYMYTCARSTCRRDESFCLDVVHDACCKLIRSMKPLPDEAALRRYVKATVQSCAYDKLRAEKRRRLREERTARESHRSGVEHEAARYDDLDERLAWLREQLEALDEPTLRLLIMRHRFGWTLSRIGAALGLKPGAVDGRLTRTTTALRQQAMETMDDECPAK
jgi:RNA polymerase sigma factor (sigma-70 family)